MAHHAQHALKQVDDVKFVFPQLDAAALEVRKIEQVVDQAYQHIAARLDGLDVILLLAGQARQVEQVGHAEDGVERRAHLVADRGDELRLCPGDSLRISKAKTRRQAQAHEQPAVGTPERHHE